VNQQLNLTQQQLNQFAVYVFVRQDLSLLDQRLQMAHTVLMMCTVFNPPQADYRIIELDGGLTKKAFDKTVNNLSRWTETVKYAVYCDSDHPEQGYTAVATVPLSANPFPHKLRRPEQKNVGNELQVLASALKKFCPEAVELILTKSQSVDKAFNEFLEFMRTSDYQEKE
jgi:hypothetical protein